MQRNQAGFAVVGSLIIASLASILLTVGQKATAGRRADARPAEIQLASLLAEQKLRELSVQPLVLSPDSSLDENTERFVEYLDKKGVLLGRAGRPPAQTAFIRRWSISPAPANPHAQVVIRVLILVHGRQPFHPVHVMMLRNRVAA